MNSDANTTAKSGLCLTETKVQVCLDECPMENRAFSSPLDPGIERAVHILLDNGVETYESCQGGEGHASPYPVVRFRGNVPEGFAALAAAMKNGLPVYALHHVWRIDEGLPTGPWWELEFRPETGQQWFPT